MSATYGQVGSYKYELLETKTYSSIENGEFYFYFYSSSSMGAASSLSGTGLNKRFKDANVSSISSLQGTSVRYRYKYSNASFSAATTTRAQALRKLYRSSALLGTSQMNAVYVIFKPYKKKVKGFVELNKKIIAR